MSVIHHKTCQICHSTVDASAEFCPSCGSELGLNIAESLPNGASSRPSFSDHQDIADSAVENSQMYAYVDTHHTDTLSISWKIGDRLTPLRKKGTISIVEENEKITIKIPRFGINTILTKIGTTILSFLFVFLNFIIATIGFLLITGLINSPIFILILISSITVAPIVNYYRNRVAIYEIRMNNVQANKIEELSEKTTENNTGNNSTVNFLLLQLIQYPLFVLIVAFANTIISISSFSIVDTATFLLIVSSILISFISPIFNISSKLSLIGNNGLFQNVIDALQFSRASFRAYISTIALSSVIPIVLFTSTVKISVSFVGSIFHLRLPFTTPSANITLFFTILTIVTLVSVITVLLDADLINQYYTILTTIVVPPPLPVDITKHRMSNSDMGILENEESNQQRENNILRCDFCSFEIPKGLNFCPNCGQKVKR